MTKTKFQKKKEREKEVKKKVLARREKVRTEAKEKTKWEQQEQAAAPKLKPLCNATIRRENEARQAEIRRQLAHNMQILRALEAQYGEDNPKPVEPNTITLVEEKPAE